MPTVRREYIELPQSAHVEAHKAYCDEIDRVRIVTGDETSRVHWLWSQRTHVLPANNAIDDAENAPLRNIMELSFGVGAEYDLGQVCRHARSGGASVPLAGIGR